MDQNKKVYIVTKAVPFGAERIYGAFSSKKSAEKALRKEYPYMRLSDDSGSLASYTADAKPSLLLFIHEMDVQ